MKHIVILADGMADRPIDSLGGKTPMEAAATPVLDQLACEAEIGMVQTVPQGMAPGSDTANLAVIGYEPEIYHTGRSPLEAASMGVELSDDDISYRCNLVTLSGHGPFQERVMYDHSAGEISSEEARELIEDLKTLLPEDMELHAGISYRHLLVWKNGEAGQVMVPPHDFLGKSVGEHLPGGSGSDRFLRFHTEALKILESHPVNQRRKVRGLNPANSIWLWGEGKRPRLDPFNSRYGLSGSVISAVDLIKGIGILAGLRSIEVEGVTGNIHTNFEGKARAAVEALASGDDFVYVHLEAPDECGHQGDTQGKLRSIELIDEKILKPIISYLEDAGEPYRMLILPDHPTPIELRTHSSDPVPYLLYQGGTKGLPEGCAVFSEAAGEKGAYHLSSGPELMRRFTSTCKLSI